MKHIVVALGGNALLRRGEAAEAVTRRQDVLRAPPPLSPRGKAGGTIP